MGEGANQRPQPGSTLPPARKALVRQLRAAVESSGLTQKSIAHQVGISRSELVNLLNGRRSGLNLGSTWDDIARVLDVPVGSITYETNGRH